MPKKIIIDCDPGLDDAIAILLAAGNPDVEIVALTTVAGNQTIEKVTLNARQVCTLAGLRGVPVAAGAAWVPSSGTRPSPPRSTGTPEWTAPPSSLRPWRPTPGTPSI